MCQTIEKVRNITRGHHRARKTYIVHISCHELLASRGINVIQHFVQQYDLALELVQLSEGLLAVVGFRFWICAGEALHEFLSSGKVSRRPSSD